MQAPRLGLEPGENEPDITDCGESDLGDFSPECGEEKAGRAAKSGAVFAKIGVEADLQEVIDAWPALTKNDKKRIMEVVQSARIESPTG